MEVKTVQIISVPEQVGEKKGSDATHNFAYSEIMNIRQEQEDALAWRVLDEGELTPEEIGHRLWTSYRIIDESKVPFGRSGTTASTTVYDGKGSLITATLADAVAFAAVYDHEGKVLGVVRLNKLTHKPSNQAETTRINAVGGVVIGGRVCGSLAVSRAIGDLAYKEDGVCSEANIDITHIDTIAEQIGINSEDIGKIQLIVCCDGFTDGAGKDNQTKMGHEKYLFDKLDSMGCPGTQSVETVVAALVEMAKNDGSEDNITVAAQDLLKNTSAFLLGVYDGHAGIEAAIYVAKEIGNVFKGVSTLSRENYSSHEFSVDNHAIAYERDRQLGANIQEMGYRRQDYLDSRQSPPSATVPGWTQKGEGVADQLKQEANKPADDGQAQTGPK